MSYSRFEATYLHHPKRDVPIALSGSRRPSVVVLEYTTETLRAFDLSSNSTDLIPGLDQLIAKPPMVPLRVVVLHVFTNGILK